MRKRLIISMMIFGLSSVMSFVSAQDNVTNKTTSTVTTSQSNEETEWMKIKDGKNEQGCRDFIAKYPNSQYAEHVASIIALYDAVHYFDQGNYGEACEQFGKAMVYNELTADMKEKYEYALHAEKYKYIGSASLKDAHIYLQDYPQGMYATQASNRIAHLMADGFDNEQRYDYSESGPNGYNYNDALAYAKDFETYQYVKNCSNAKAERYYYYANEETNSSLKWAQDKKTVSYVEDKYKAYLNRRFWWNRFALGWEYFSNDYSANTYGIGMGFTFRIGRYEDSYYFPGDDDDLSPFNIIFGAKWVYNQVYLGWKRLDDYEFNQFGHHLIGSVQLRWNIKEVGRRRSRYGSWYFGGGGEYSYKFGGDLNLGGAYVVGQFGYAMRNWDIGVYYKHRVYEEVSKYPLLNEYIDDDNYRIGLSMILYFMLNQ